jgi:hypothetical protein
LAEVKKIVENPSESKEIRKGKATGLEVKKCGIIMPIASMLDYTADHWQDVKSIIKEAVDTVDGVLFKTDIVSDSEGEINIIHKNIISNIYNSDIVVCDISGRNPNVLFELGMRLTFDKPTIIIKDDATDYLFDISSIETLTYPKDLRFGKIVAFKKLLASKIKSSYEKAVSDTSYSPFLGSFGEFKVPKLDQSPATPDQILIEEIANIRSEMRMMRKELSFSRTVSKGGWNESKRLDELRETELDSFVNVVRKYLIDSRDPRDPIKILHSPQFFDWLANRSIKYDFSAESLNRKAEFIYQLQQDLGLI